MYLCGYKLAAVDVVDNNITVVYTASLDAPTDAMLEVEFHLFSVGCAAPIAPGETETAACVPSAGKHGYPRLLYAC